MPSNQNETEERGARSEERRVCRVAAPRVARRHSAIRNPQSAFTLTELLVVIAIIAVLAALATAAAIRAWNTAKKEAIRLEIKNIEIAVEDFKNKYGAYPPNAASDTSMPNDASGKSILSIHANDMQLMFKRAFQRSDEPPALIAELTGNGTQLQAGLTGAEALVFWLGGFSEDTKYPISGSGGPSFLESRGVEDFSERNSIYEFDLGRLGPRDSNGNFAGRSIPYDGPDGRRIINLWTYNAKSSNEPIFYFDTSRHRASLEDGTPNYDPWFFAEAVGVNERFAIKQLNATNQGRVEFANQGKYQLIHCGIDDLWGDLTLFSMQRSGGPLVYPEGPFIGEIADTITNFTEGSLEDDQE